MPGITAATSQFDWLIAITAITVLSCSNAVSNLLGLKDSNMDAGDAVSPACGCCSQTRFGPVRVNRQLSKRPF
jgi:hypothetical protein